MEAASLRVLEAGYRLNVTAQGHTEGHPQAAPTESSQICIYRVHLSQCFERILLESQL